MALAIKDAHKLLEGKQKRINDTHTSLLNLRNACIVCPNSASEVFLAGSFDGWATQKKMEKSSTGIFYVSLKLYPGRYEVGFLSSRPLYYITSQNVVNVHFQTFNSMYLFNIYKSSSLWTVNGKSTLFSRLSMTTGSRTIFLSSCEGSYASDVSS